MKKVKHTLIRNGKEIFSSDKKIDTVFEHQKYKRGQRVQYRAVSK